MTPGFHAHADRLSLQSALLAAMREAIEVALAARGEALIGLSGGSTPIPVYQALAQLELPWSKLRFLLVDERFVDITHADSNEGQLRQALAAAGPALRLTGLRGEAAEITAAAAEASRRLAALPRADLLLLGMGEDGHVASLFPAGPGCREGRDPEQTPAIIATWPEPLPAGAPHPRLSLNRAAIATARQCLLMISGAAKRAVWERASADPGLPVADLLADGMPPLHVHWSP